MWKTISTRTMKYLGLKFDREEIWYRKSND